MAIRITGMYSGLDTESIINELASAQSYKKNKLVKERTKLSWKQDAWKALNTKIYSFYQKLDDLRLQSSYMKKKSTVSNPNAIKVVSGQMDGTHTVSVSQLAKKAVLTGGSLIKNDVCFTGDATLKQLGFKGKNGSISVNGALGQEIEVEVSEDMTINQFVDAIKKTGLNASYDVDNQRIYMSSRDTGADANFWLSANDDGGMQALSALKLLSKQDIESNMGAYTQWANYHNADGSYTEDYKKVISDEILSRLEALKKENDELKAHNDKIDEANKKNRDMLKEIRDNVDGKYDAYKDFDFVKNYSDAWTDDDVIAAGKALYDTIYGKEEKEPVMDDSNPPQQKVDEEGNPIFKTVRKGGMAQKLDALKEELTTAQDDLKAKQQALADAKKDGADAATIAAKEADVKAAQTAVKDKQDEITAKQGEISKASEVYSFYNAFEQNLKMKEDNTKRIEANDAKFSYDETTKTYKEKDESGNEIEIGDAGGLVGNDVRTQFDAKVAIAQDVVNKKADYLKNAGGTKIDGQNSKVVVDGVEYSSVNDTVTVNGMTLTAMEVTDKDVTVTTTDDTDGVYDMIKDFFKSYNELINEMDSLYNAESSKGYEPLLSEEKEALTDTEIEEWEKKIKDSLLRRDSTLSMVSTALKQTMLKGININGQNIYLSDFGIATLGYFNSADNERNAYHIDGDPDDLKTKNNEDMLKTLISKNPDAVMQFFTGLTNNLHDELADKMSATKMSSALTVYNDKKMKEEYDEYGKKIKKQEEKLNDYIDKWYAKFSAMEVALSKLESKNSSLSSLFGG